MLTANQARDLGNAVQRLRLRKGITRYEAAAIVGMPHLTYARLEHGRLPEDGEQALTRAWSALQIHHVARGA